MRLRSSILTLALGGLFLHGEALASEELSIEEKIEALEAKRARLVEERDAARMRANVYVLPKDKLEVLAKEAEIEEIDQELEALRKEEEPAPGRGRPRTRDDRNAPL